MSVLLTERNLPTMIKLCFIDRIENIGNNTFRTLYVHVCMNIYNMYACLLKSSETKFPIKMVQGSFLAINA